MDCTSVMRLGRRVLVGSLYILAIGWTPAAAAADPAEELPAVVDFAKLPGNRWVLIHREDDSGGRSLPELCWPTGSIGCTSGAPAARAGPQRLPPLRVGELRIDEARLAAAFPAAAGKWTAERYPPFRILGQSGPDGLKHDEGPRLQCVGGYHATNRVRWWDFDGILRPSPIHTFNMACWDAKRQRIVYYSDGCTFALDPRTNDVDRPEGEEPSHDVPDGRVGEHGL